LWPPRKLCTISNWARLALHLYFLPCPDIH
jgi:hypothetical protein